MLAPTTVHRATQRLRRTLSEAYKYALGRALGFALRATSLDFPPGAWPPPTPARRYIGSFLDEFAEAVRGRCVEFGPPVYRSRFVGNGAVSSYDVWDVEPGPESTIVADLQAASELADGSFDTIICTHVLCSIPRPWLAVDELHRLLSPGGVLLCTNPVVLQRYAPHPFDCWRFTPDSMALLFTSFSRVELRAYGNAATVAGSPLFLMDRHFSRRVLDVHDARSPSVVAAAAWK